jgi:hypothetical protein
MKRTLALLAVSASALGLFGLSSASAAPLNTGFT